MHSTSTRSEKLVARSAKFGRGLFATAAIGRGEWLVRWDGREVDSEEIFKLDPAQRTLSIQIGPSTYLVPEVLSDADFVNHSCNPNAGFSGDRTLIAMVDIQAGDEVCFDYAMSDSSKYDEFPCGCGSSDCRKRVTGEDWKRPDLQLKYRGYFSPYLAQQIKKTT